MLESGLMDPCIAGVMLVVVVPVNERHGLADTRGVLANGMV